MQQLCAYLSKFFQCLWISGVGVILLVFVFLPMASVQRLLGLNSTFVEDRFLILIIGALLFTSFTYLLNRFFELVKSTPHSGFPPPSLNEKVIPTYVTIAQWILSLILIARATNDIFLPFDNDELSVALNILKNDYTGFWKLFVNSTHPLGTWSAVLSTKLLGVSIWTIRLPALFFGTAFLIVLYQFSRKHLSNMAILFIYGHLASSAIVVWYFHSLRGYASMMLLVLYLYFSTLSYTNTDRAWTPINWICFLLTFLVLPFSHGFASLFGILLPFSIAFWALFNQSHLSPRKIWKCSHLVLLLLSFSPWLIFSLAYSIFYSVEAKYLGIAGSSSLANETLSSAVTIVLGSNHILQLKLLFILTVLLTIFHFRSKITVLPFSLVVFGVFWSTIIVQRLLLGTYVTGRFFLGILPIFLVALLELIEGLKLKIPRVCSYGLALVSLIVFPLIDGNPYNFQIDHSSFYPFIKRIKPLISSAPKNCIQYTYSGAQPAQLEALLTEHFYMSNRNTPGVDCIDRFQVHFGWPWQTFHEYTDKEKRRATLEDIPRKEPAEVLYSDSEGRYLLRIIAKVNPIVQSQNSTQLSAY